jgi:anti-sigma factor RsiW
MMQKPNDETLIAYLDGELDPSVHAEVEVWLEKDAALRDHAASLTESARLLRAAFDPVLHEPIPQRLLVAARGEATSVVDIDAARQKRSTAPRGGRSWVQWAAAAGVAGLLIGGGTGFFFAGPGASGPQTPNLAATNWIDNIAGYHKLFVSAGPDDLALVDVPANGNGGDARKAIQKLPSDFRLPNLQPWGLQFQGARFLFIEGQPGTQLFYTTDNKALGPLTVVVANSTKPDLAPTFDRRDDLNVLYWRHHGHAYALVGAADIGYLWNISNDIAYQLDAI